MELEAQEVIDLLTQRFAQKNAALEKEIAFLLLENKALKEKLDNAAVTDK